MEDKWLRESVENLIGILLFDSLEAAVTYITYIETICEEIEAPIEESVRKFFDMVKNSTDVTGITYAIESLFLDVNNNKMYHG